MTTRVSLTWLLGGWFATLALVIGICVAVGASLSTTALVIALSLALPVIMLMIGSGARTPTVAELLHSTEGKQGR